MNITSVAHTHSGSYIWMLKCSVQFSRSVMSNSLWPNALHHRQASLSITSSQSLLKLMSIKSVISSNHIILCCPLFFLPSIFPAWRFFQGVSYLHQVARVLEFQLQHQSFQCKLNWFPLGMTGWIFLQSKELLSVFSNTRIQKHQVFGTHLSLWSNSHIHTWLLEKL